MSRAFAQFSYDDAPAGPAVLVVGDTHGARERARDTAELGEFAVQAAVPVDEGLSALAAARDVSAIWLELDEALTVSGRRLIERVGVEAARMRAGVVVSTRLEHVDELLFELGETSIELLVNAEEAERLGFLTMAASQLHRARASEASTEANAARLRQLSEEVSRIASALARLSSTSTQAPLSPATMAPPPGDVPVVSAEAVRAMIRARRLRTSYFPPDLFADPAWDMLLDLLQAEIIQSRVPVSSLCSAAAVPATTALRWIKTMTDRGLLVRRNDPHDGRRVFIEMAPATSASLRHYFKDVGVAAI